MRVGAFKFEKEMLSPASHALRRALRLRAGTVTLIEPSIGNVIPDVLFCSFNGSSFSESAVRVTHLEATLLAAIEAAGECTMRELLSAIFISEQRAIAALVRLEKVRRIERTLSGSYRLTAGTSSDSVELVAIEFKLRRWSEALEQAAEYRKFADRAYVVVDGAQVGASDHIKQAFQSKSVGLLRQFGRRLEVVCDAQLYRPQTASRVIAVCKAAQHGALLNA